MNNWYNRIVGQAPVPVQSPQMTPFQALMNPVAFIKQQCPDIPDEIMNNPSQVFNYLMSTRGLNQQQRQILNQQSGGNIYGR